MHELILDFMESGGYAAIALLMALENLLPPVPSEFILGIAGLGVQQGRFEFVPLLIAGTLGSTIGNYVLFALGKRMGFERLHPFVNRWGRWLTVEWDDVRKASRYFQRHGEWLVFFLRFAPFVRTLVSFPAGLAHMPTWKFLVFTMAGSAFWNAALIYSGMWLGLAFGEMSEWLSAGTFAMIIACLAWYAWRVWTWQPKVAPRLIRGAATN